MGRDTKLTVCHLPSQLSTNYSLETWIVEFQRPTPPTCFGNVTVLATVYLEQLCVFYVNTFLWLCPISGYSPLLAFCLFSCWLEEYRVDSHKTKKLSKALLFSDEASYFS